jgi:hypothetical protein
VSDWIWQNKEWVFSGVGVAIVAGVIAWFRRSPGSGQSQRSGKNSVNIQAGRDINLGDGGKRGR